MISTTELIQNRDWNKLYEKYKNFTFLQCKISDRHSEDDIHDLMQEVWIKVFLNIDKLIITNDNSFIAWLRIICRNAKVDYLRRNKNKERMFRSWTPKELSVTSTDDEHLERTFSFEVADEVNETEKEISEKVSIVLNAIDTLKDNHKDVFLLRLKYSYKEISMITKQNINTNLGCMRYAKTNIKKLISTAAILLMVFFCNAQAFTDSADAVNFHPVWNPADTNTISPTVYLYPTFVTAKCKIIVTDCKNCRQRVVNCYRKNDTDFYTDQALTKKIVFRNGWWWRIWNKELYFFNWYDVNW